MKTLRVALLTGAAVLLSMLGSQALARGDKDRSLKADLEGFQEVTVVSTTGSGELRIRVNHDQTAFDYKLTYEDLEGAVTQSHIHLAQKNVNGGIVIWLCQTAAAPAPKTIPAPPTCPGPSSGEVTGTVDASNVSAVTTQGIAAGDFAEVLDAIREGVAYANVHTVTSPGGEIRGQIRH
jgi:multidrug efflux pump subunit AcrB